jgi:hypothetical protein
VVAQKARQRQQAIQDVAKASGMAQGGGGTGHGGVMAWTRLDDRWDIGTKMVRAFARIGDAAVCMWARGVTHCNRDLTDGKIHGDVLRSLTRHRRPHQVVCVLADVGLIEDCGGDTYQFHDFLDWNASREEVEATRRTKRISASKGGKAKAETCHRASTVLDVRQASGTSLECPSPDPIRIRSEDPDPPLVPPSGGPTPAAPAPKPTKPAKGPKPATRQPADDVDPWLAALDVPAVDSAPWGPQVAAWLDHHAAKGSRFADWAAAWRTWARNAVKFGHVDADPATARRSLQAPPAQREQAPTEPAPNARLAAWLATAPPVPVPPMPADPVAALAAMVGGVGFLAREGGATASGAVVATLAPSGPGQGPPAGSQRAEP